MVKFLQFVNFLYGSEFNKTEIDAMHYSGGFKDARDVKDLICGHEGYKFDSNCFRVKLAHGCRGQSSYIDHCNSYSSISECSRGVSRQSEYHILVTSLPPLASWQDLENHLRWAGNVFFSHVFFDSNETTGIVDYTNYDDIK